MPPEYQNIEDYSKIADFIFQGTPIKDSNLFEIAKQVSKKIAKNYRYKLEGYEIDSGLDNYPYRIEFFLKNDLNEQENE